jgi:glycosyltransferase involved in cell wall biosynthesis
MQLKDRPYIFLPGGLHFRKNAEVVLKTWAKLRSHLRDHLLVIAGHSEREYVSWANALGADILQTGFIDDEVLCSLYHRARVVWFPSKYEGFGVPVLEAMACGAPVVTSNSTAIPEIAGDAAILVRPDSVDGQAEALESVCRDRALSEQLIGRGHRRARQFAWKDSAAKLLTCFRAII